MPFGTGHPSTFKIPASLQPSCSSTSPTPAIHAVAHSGPPPSPRHVLDDPLADLLLLLPLGLLCIMSAVIEDRPFSTLPRNSPPAAVAGLPSFNFPPRDPSLDPSSQQKTPTQASFDAAAATPSATALHRTSASSPTVRPYRSDSNRDRINAHRTNASLESIQSDVKTEDRDSGDDSDASTSRPSKKKKGQRFYCTDYPPCNLSFTRSEHLARHIR